MEPVEKRLRAVEASVHGSSGHDSKAGSGDTSDGGPDGVSGASRPMGFVGAPYRGLRTPIQVFLPGVFPVRSVPLDVPGRRCEANVTMSGVWVELGEMFGPPGHPLPGGLTPVDFEYFPTGAVPDATFVPAPADPAPDPPIMAMPAPPIPGVAIQRTRSVPRRPSDMLFGRPVSGLNVAFNPARE